MTPARRNLRPLLTRPLTALSGRRVLDRAVQPRPRCFRRLPRPLRKHRLPASWGFRPPRQSPRRSGQPLRRLHRTGPGVPHHRAVRERRRRSRPSVIVLCEPFMIQQLPPVFGLRGESNGFRGPRSLPARRSSQTWIGTEVDRHLQLERTAATRTPGASTCSTPPRRGCGPTTRSPMQDRACAPGRGRPGATRRAMAMCFTSNAGAKAWPTRCRAAPRAPRPGARCCRPESAAPASGVQITSSPPRL